MRKMPHWNIGILFFLSIASFFAMRKGVSATPGESSNFLPIISKELHQAQKGIWILNEEIFDLPTSGPAWERLIEEANESIGYPNLSDRDQNTNLNILAKALVFARTGESKYRQEVTAALSIITFQNTEEGDNTLPLSRNLAAYVIAADLIELGKYDPFLDAHFRNKLRGLLTKELDELNLRSTHEQRPNNWGTNAGASRAAIAIYLEDEAELQRTAQVFKGWLGDRSAYAGFNFDDDLSWQCNPDEPVGVNPEGCSKAGHDIGGALPEEMRRGGSFQWPPIETNYPWGSLQGALVQAEVLHRAGYPAWEWGDKALLRAMLFLYSIGWEAEDDDEWQIWLINRVYATSFPIDSPAGKGKIMGFTDWTHAP